MTEQQPCNTTTHCGLCPPLPASGRNWSRVRIASGGDDGTGPRIAVCPKHDIAGPVAALPASMRRAVTP